MPQFLGEELADTMLAALGEALDLVDCGFMLLDQDMRVRFVNDAFAQLIAIEQPMSFGVRPARAAEPAGSRHLPLRCGPARASWGGGSGRGARKRNPSSAQRPGWVGGAGAA